MKWSIFVCLFVCLARFCEGGAIPCPPGVTECVQEKVEENTDKTESPSTSSSPPPPSSGPQTECLAGTEWESNCHYCRCSASGVAECLKGANCDFGVYEEPYLCKPNTTFLRECNSCVCLENGLVLCSLQRCEDDSDILFSPLRTIKDVGKEELQSKSTNVLPPSNNTKAIVCTANRMFVKDCNTCWCNEDGTSYFCTRRVCVPLFPDEEPDLGGIPAENLELVKKECQPDEVFEMDCNMCRCNPDGKSYSCTRRACMEPLHKKNGSLTRITRALSSDTPKACQPGQEFRMDCNKCLCDDQGKDFSCTRIDCNALNNNQASALRSKRQVAKQEVPSKCVPGSVFNRDCNACRCTEDGFHAMCTLQSCQKKGDTETETRAPESDFRCNPGEQFKHDCNDCTCSADGKSVFCALHLCDFSI